ncbi:hypothetical protein [Rhizobium sp. CIAT894]|nr:hypothetical protein [Rhizobium sp. CIAT894]
MTIAANASPDSVLSVQPLPIGISRKQNTLACGEPARVVLGIFD